MHLFSATRTSWDLIFWSKVRFLNVLLGNVNSWAQIVCAACFFCKTVKLCTYVHLVWAFQGWWGLGEAIHWAWINAYGAHEPIYAQEAKNKSHTRAHHGQNPPYSRFCGYFGPDTACKWGMWGWESSGWPHAPSLITIHTSVQYLWPTLLWLFTVAWL